MAQLFSNSVDTTLAATLTIGGTSATLTDGSKLKEPAGADFELLTLQAAGNTEIVRVTARTGNTVTITREQESTTAREWPTGTRVTASVTAGTLEALADPGSSLTNAATGTDALAVLGTSAALRGVALGKDAIASGDNAIAVGSNVGASGAEGIAVGRNASGEGAESIAIGGTDTVGSQSRSQAAGSIALGRTHAITPNTMQVGALQAVPRERGTGLGSVAAWQMSGPEMVIMSKVIDFKALSSYTIEMPAGVHFFPNEAGVIATYADTVTGQPSFELGITSNTDLFLAATATAGLAANHDRHRFASLLSGAGVSELRAEVTAVATGTWLEGRIYWRGMAVVDS